MNLLDALRTLTENIKEWAENKFAKKDESAAKTATITLPASNWIGDTNPWYQVVECDGMAANSKPDLQPNPNQLVELQEAEISLMTINENGVAKVYAFNDKPQNDLVMQVFLTAVADGAGVIYGNVVGGSSGLDKTFLLEDENGVQVLGVVVDEEIALTATDSDVTLGKTYANSNGISTGTHVCE